MKLCVRYDLYIEECKDGKEYLYTLEIDESDEDISWKGKKYKKMVVRYGS